MAKGDNQMKSAQAKLESSVMELNENIGRLGEYAADLNKSLTKMQSLIDNILDYSEGNRAEYKHLKKVRENWRDQANKIEMEQKKQELEVAGKGAIGTAGGVALAALGPSAAMGIATTFGVASTGTAISALTGSAATNAALAWLGGGTLAAGGGGMAAGNALLALVGPLGWTIAGVSLVATGLMYHRRKEDTTRLEAIYTRIYERDNRIYKRANYELTKRIKAMKEENTLLGETIQRIETLGNKYREMTEAQQYELGTCIELMEVPTMLLVSPITSLQANYQESDFK